MNRSCWTTNLAPWSTTGLKKLLRGLLACRRLCLRAEGKAGERSETDGGTTRPSSALRAPSPLEKVKDFCNLAGSFVFSFPLGKLASAARLMRGTTRPSSALRAPSPLEKLKDFCNLAGSLPKAPQPSQEKLSFSGAACAFQAATPKNVLFGPRGVASHWKALRPLLR